ncbi:hypothetical protein ACJW31_09G132400 [Castanea mollissima]
MVHNAFLKLLVFFLGFSFILSSAVVPITRSLRSTREDPSGEVDMKEVEEMFEAAEGIMERRMDMERADSPGTGANHHHDPKTPKRA